MIRTKYDVVQPVGRIGTRTPDISMKRASSRVSKLSFGGDEIRTYEKVSFLVIPV